MTTEESDSAKIVLITGASRGIGFEAVRLLAAQGHTVILSARDRLRGESAVDALKAENLPGAVHFLHLDVTDSASIASAVERISGQFGMLDVLVNNAAILRDHYVKASDVEPATLDQTLSTNVTAVHAMISAFQDLLKKSGRARIINLASGAGQLTWMFDKVWAPAYQISKAGVNAVTRIWATELQADGIPVNSVCPGWCRTEMGGDEADRSAEEGTSGILWLVNEAPNSVTGKFFRDQKELDW
jgi:NAD(P)-dependent dehydrogenase (short-subunit alcohol dehydrogenase family)